MYNETHGQTQSSAQRTEISSNNNKFWLMLQADSRHLMSRSWFEEDRSKIEIRWVGTNSRLESSSKDRGIRAAHFSPHIITST
jgi:hypothetical protein